MFGIGTKKARLHVDAFVNMLGEDNQVHLPIPLLHRREHVKRIKIKKEKVVQATLLLQTLYYVGKGETGEKLLSRIL